MNPPSPDLCNKAIFHSRDLVHWRLACRSLSRESQLDLRGDPDCGGVWAPGLSHADGVFWLVYTDMKRRTGNYKDAHNYLVTAPAIEKPWSDPVHLGAGAFDPSLFRHDDGRKRSVAPDLPGHGDSDPAAAGDHTPARLAADIAALIAALDLAPVRIAARGLGAAVAVELAHAQPDFFAALRLAEVAALTAGETAVWHARLVPDTAPRRDGKHLLTLWHALRDGEMFWPWFDTRAAAARRIEPALDAGFLATRFLAALLCRDLRAAHAAAIGWDAPARLCGLACPVEIAAVPGDGWARDAARLAAAAGSRLVDLRPEGDGLAG